MERGVGDGSLHRVGYDNLHGFGNASLQGVTQGIQLCIHHMVVSFKYDIWLLLFFLHVIYGCHYLRLNVIATYVIVIYGYCCTQKFVISFSNPN